MKIDDNILEMKPGDKFVLTLKRADGTETEIILWTAPGKPGSVVYCVDLNTLKIGEIGKA